MNGFFFFLVSFIHFPFITVGFFFVTLVKIFTTTRIHLTQTVCVNNFLTQRKIFSWFELVFSRNIPFFSLSIFFFQPKKKKKSFYFSFIIRMSFFSCFFPVHTTQGNPHTQHIRIGWWWWSITNNSCFAGYTLCSHGWCFQRIR